MSEQNPFASYEYVGIIAPGLVVVIAATWTLPGAPTLITPETSLGTFGIVLALAFVAGHLVQAIGNLIEWLLWAVLGGMPSTWPLTGTHKLLTDSQTSTVKSLARHLNEGDNSKDTWTVKEAFSIGRQFYTMLDAVERTERLEIFNRNYGLLRGLCAGLLVAAAMASLKSEFPVATALVVLAAIAAYRMFKFGKNYGRELHLQFITLSKSPAKAHSGQD